MKKFAVILSVLALAGCANTTGQGVQGEPRSDGLMMNVFKKAVDHQCRTQLNKNDTYKMISILMTDNQKQMVEDKTCGCVSEHAPNHVNLSQLGQAAIDSSARERLVVDVVKKTLTTCVSDWLNKPVS